MTKSAAGFTSIAPDHGTEQENHAVIGGIIGITQNEKALDKYFLTAPELSKYLHDFVAIYDIGERVTRTHEISGGTLSRMMSYASKLSQVFHAHRNPFTEEFDDELYNLLTREVMNDKVSKDILERDQIGEEMLKQFGIDRLTEGKLGVWDKMQKWKLQTFKSTSTTAEMRMGDKLIKVKEERGLLQLLQRLIVVSRSQSELDLKECIGAYESGVIPCSLFASDGSMLFAYDKAKILHQLEKLL